MEPRINTFDCLSPRFIDIYNFRNLKEIVMMLKLMFIRIDMYTHSLVSLLTREKKVKMAVYCSDFTYTATYADEVQMPLQILR